MASPAAAPTACAQRATSRPVRSSAPAHAALATAKSAKPPAPIGAHRERRGRPLEGDQRDREHDGVDADDGRDALDRGVEVAQDVRQRQRHDRRVGQAQARGDGEDVGARAHTRAVSGSAGDVSDPGAEAPRRHRGRDPRARPVRLRDLRAGDEPRARRGQRDGAGGHRRRGAGRQRGRAGAPVRRAAPARSSTTCCRRPASPARTSSSPTWSRRARPATATRGPTRSPTTCRSSMPSSRSSARACSCPSAATRSKRFAPGPGHRRGPRPRRPARRADAVPDVPPRRGAAQPAPHDDAGRRRPGAEAGAVKPIRVGCSGWNYADWRGVLYPPGCPQRKWLAALRRGLRHRRGQQHLLPAAHARGGARVGGADAAGLRLRGEVQPLPDPHQAPDRHGPGRGPPARAPRAAHRLAQDGPDALAAPGQLPPRRRAPGLRAGAPAAGAPRLRVPPRELVRRRRPGRAARPRRRARHRRPPRAPVAAPRADGRLHLRAPALRASRPARQLQRHRARRVGARARAPGARARRSSPTSTTTGRDSRFAMLGGYGSV